ncbi:uncharacterized protein BN649_01140 [Clostridium sp. CAG:413]|jgi:hypothetical protein|nr:uncharacterized protein BN649_01140 [Clostridium sp. CAG:413]
MEQKIFIAIFVVAVVAELIAAYKVFGIDKVKSWLLWAVTQAEAQFGEKTGKLKLAYVYDIFVGKFPKLQAVIPFAVFAKLVDAALESMKSMLNNANIAAIVRGDDDGGIRNTKM